MTVARLNDKIENLRETVAALLRANGELVSEVRTLAERVKKLEDGDRQEV